MFLGFQYYLDRDNDCARLHGKWAAKVHCVPSPSGCGSRGAARGAPPRLTAGLSLWVQKGLGLSAALKGSDSWASS